MAVSLSDKKRKEYKAAFAKYDKSGDGKISKGELREALKEQNRVLPDAVLTEMFEKIDANNSGFIEYSEFEQMLVDIDGKLMKEAFDAIDSDHNGFITEDEMAALFKRLGIIVTPEKLQGEMKKVDKNKDNKISLEEFKKVFDDF